MYQKVSVNDNTLPRESILTLTIGGFAHVYKVEISPKENETSIACLKRVAVPDKVSLNILRAEVDSMKRVKGHRHVVSYIDSHAARMPTGLGYEVFVLMEYCANKGLIDFMNTRLENRLREDEVLRIMGEVTEGVANMHALDPPLIHRDIKIENVLISGNGDYKLCDFGSASPVLRPPRDADEFAILQNDVLRNTTAQYRAPEMIDLYRGLPVDEKSDIWALGIFLYKLCYYTTPFEEKGELAILHATFSFPKYPVYSERLKNLISVLLREDPRRRPNAYQTLEEVCKMRSVPMPIDDFTKRKNITSATFNPKVHPTKIPLPQPSYQAQPQAQAQPQILSQSSNTTDVSILPRSTVSSTQLQQSNNLRPLKQLNTEMVNVSLSPGKKDPFADIDTSNFLKSKSTSPQPPPKHARPTSSSQIYSNNPSNSNLHANNLSKSVGNLSIYDTKKESKPPVPAKPKYVDSIVQTVDQDEEKLKSEARLKSQSRPLPPKKRPQSMYVLPSQAKSFEKSPAEKNGETNELKRIITGLSSQSNTVELSPGENHINSNVDFLKNLERQDSGKVWSKQHTGESVNSLRRISTGSKKVGALIGHFTGKLSRSHSRSQSRSQSRTSSRASSIHEASGVYSTHTGNSTKFRSSSESIEEEIIIPEENRKTLNRSSSIQRRVQALLNRNNDPPVVKTAKGYGNDEDNKADVDADGFKKPSVIKRKPPVPTKKIIPSTPPLSAQSTPSTITRTPKPLKETEIYSPSTLKKSAPPIKPKKPLHLKTLAVNNEGDDDKSRLDVTLKVHSKKNSISSEISLPDIDDLEKDFNERYPSAV